MANYVSQLFKTPQEFEKFLSSIDPKFENIKNELANGSLVVAKAEEATSAGNAGYAGSAGNADYATEADHATSADNATNADHATSADNATNADHATSADNATNATNADHATSADNATNATNADHAQSADNATNATNAVHAQSAGKLSSAYKTLNYTGYSSGKNIQVENNKVYVFVVEFADPISHAYQQVTFVVSTFYTFNQSNSVFIAHGTDDTPYFYHISLNRNGNQYNLRFMEYEWGKYVDDYSKTATIKYCEIGEFLND